MRLDISKIVTVPLFVIAECEKWLIGGSIRIWERAVVFSVDEADDDDDGDTKEDWAAKAEERVLLWSIL